MTLPELLQRLIDIDAKLIPDDGGKLVVEGDPALLTDEIVDAVRRHKWAILRGMAAVERAEFERIEREAMQNKEFH